MHEREQHYFLGRDMVYGIRFWGDQGSGFDLKYGIGDQHIFWIRIKIRILALRSGSQLHKMFDDQGSESNINGKKWDHIKKNIPCHDPVILKQTLQFTYHCI